MANSKFAKTKKADRRRTRVRSKVSGSSERPRLSVTKSLKNIFAQIVDDERMVTLIGLSSTSKELAGLLSAKDSKTNAAKVVGKKLAELAKAKGITQVVFDRNKHRYHGRIKAVADGAREGGLSF